VITVLGSGAFPIFIPNCFFKIKKLFEKFCFRQAELVSASNMLLITT